MRPWENFKIKAAVVVCSGLFMTGCGSLMPYDDEFTCSNSFKGVCETPLDAYQDSKTGIQPQYYNEEWKEGRMEWEAANQPLLQARGQAQSNKSFAGEAAGYRDQLFNQMEQAFVRSEAPVLVNPEPISCLILDSLGRNDDTLYTTPHYVYFYIDKPRWALKKIKELHSVQRPSASSQYHAKFTNPSGKSPKISLQPVAPQSVTEKSVIEEQALPQTETDKENVVIMQEFIDLGNDQGTKDSRLEGLEYSNTEAKIDED